MNADKAAGSASHIYCATASHAHYIFAAAQIHHTQHRLVAKFKLQIRLQLRHMRRMKKMRPTPSVALAAIFYRPYLEINPHRFRHHPQLMPLFFLVMRECAAERDELLPSLCLEVKPVVDKIIVILLPLLLIISRPCEKCKQQKRPKKSCSRRHS